MQRGRVCLEKAALTTIGRLPRLLIFISTCASNATRRSSLRNSWFRYLTEHDSPLSAEDKANVKLVFVASKHASDEQLRHEQETEGDVVLVDAPEGYENLWRKALVFLASLLPPKQALLQPLGEVEKQEEGRCDKGSSSSSAMGMGQFDFVMHADDDSFVRLDLLLPFLAGCAYERFYWGYIWDGTGNRVTAPIRNPLNKSHMLEHQYALDFYPPFASGCGFVLSWDLVLELTKQPLPDYRLLDPPFGIHLCGGPDWCVVAKGGPVTPVHDERVRPYRPIPIFRPDTIVQHYLRPEEMKPFYVQAKANELAGSGLHPVEGGERKTEGESSASSMVAGDATPEHLYNTLVQLGLLRR